MNEKIYGAKNDLVFKKIFGDLKNKTAIKGFLSSILDLPEDEYDVLHVENPFLNIDESAKDKIGILDVKLQTKNKKIIDIEIQVARMNCMRERILYYLSKMTLEQIGSGQEYGRIQKVISIIIAADHILIEENDNQHNRYVMHDAKTGSTFTDKMEINTLDLMKASDKNTSNPELANWVNLFNADTKEELEMVHNSLDPAIKQAADVIMTVNQDKDLRVKAEQRENAVRAYKSEITASIEKGKAEGKTERNIEIAKNSLKRGLDVETICEITGLTPEEIEKLK